MFNNKCKRDKRYKALLIGFYIFFILIVPTLKRYKNTRGWVKKIQKKIARSITLHAIGQNWLKKND